MASMPAFTLAANLGLVLFLFLVGLEVDLRFLISNWRVALSVGAAGMALPFGLGIGIAYGLYHHFRTEPGTQPIGFGTYALFIGVALAITAFPVLCRILTSLKLLGTPVGVIVLSAGVGNDVVGWILLALCVALVNSGAGLTALWIFLVAIGYCLFLAFLVRPAFVWVLRRSKSLENGPTQGVVALTLLLVLASSFFTSIIGIHQIFGAFMIGLICPHEGGFAIKLTEKIEDLVSTLFLPLYFALSGLSTNLGLLDNGMTWAYVVGVTAIAFFGKIAGGTLASRVNGLVWRESLTIGCLMSCKGLVELIVLNIGLQAKILSTRTFTIFVVMALVTTFATTPLVSWLYPPWYQEKLELWKRGKIDWDGTPLAPSEAHNSADLDHDVDVASRVLVYLRTDGLSSLFNIMSLFTGHRYSSHKDADGLTRLAGERTGTEKHLLPKVDTMDFERPLRVRGLRLLELTERNSSAMKVSELEEYAARDPIIKAFGSCAYSTARDVTISGQIAVVPDHSFADTLVQRANSSRSHLILLPWSETGTISEVPSAFDRAPLGANVDPLANKEYSSFVDSVFNSAQAICSIGVFIDRSLLKPSTGIDDVTGLQIQTMDRPRLQLSRRLTGISMTELNEDHGVVFKSSDEKGVPQIRVMYTGLPDDIYAIKLATQLAKNGGIHVRVVRVIVSQPSGSLSEAQDLPSSSDEQFLNLKSGISAFMKSNIEFEEVVASSAYESVVLDTVLLNRPSESGNVTVFVGRGLTMKVGTGGSPPIVSTDKYNALGSLTTALVARMRENKITANVFVVQSKTPVHIEERRKGSTTGTSEDGAFER